MNSDLKEIRVKTPLTSSIIIVVLFGGLIIIPIVALITFVYLFLDSLINKGVINPAYVIITILVLIPFSFIMISLKMSGNIFKTDTVTKKGITFNGYDYYWKDVNTIYVNKELDYLIILFNGIHGGGNWAGIVFWKKYIDPSTEELMSIARKVDVKINEDEILTHSELMKIRDERIAKNNI